MIIKDKIKSRTFYIIVIIFLTILFGCHNNYLSKEKKFSSLPSMIDTSLIGIWKIDIILMDAAYIEYDFIEFTKDRHIFFKGYYGDRPYGDLSGVYRIIYDTLYVLFNRRVLETYLYKLSSNKSKLYLEPILAEKNGFTLTSGGWYKSNVNYQED